MPRKFLLGLAVAATSLACASIASATTYSIDGIVNTTANGFGSSMFHDQTNGQMNGTTLATPTNLLIGGTWNSTTGAIAFGFDVDGGSAIASGTLTLNPGRTGNGYTGLSGSLDISFSGTSQFDTITSPFVFADSFFTNPNEPNGTNFSQISLWGDLGNYSSSTCAAGAPTCVGLDLRLAISELPGAPQIPLPAPALLLLAGLGGLGLVRRKTR